MQGLADRPLQIRNSDLDGGKDRTHVVFRAVVGTVAGRDVVLRQAQENEPVIAGGDPAPPNVRSRWTTVTEGLDAWAPCAPELEG